MNAVDTNVLLYSIDRHEPVKQAKAQQTLQQLRAATEPTFLLWQVLGEFVRHLRAWEQQGTITRAGLLRYVVHFRTALALRMPQSFVIDLALDLSKRYSLSHWDSMILGACIDAGVDTLYTEDMGSPTKYDTVQLLNPFL